MAEVIRVNNISKLYLQGKVIALDNVNFTIQRGEIIGVIGRNGAGKSTLFKIICGVIKPTNGTVEIIKSNKRLDSVSYLPEIRGLNPRQQVFEHLTDLLCYKGIRRTDSTQMVAKWLARFQMEKYKYDRIDTLSKGNQQRLQFISAVANEPDVLILDEPFSGLDIISSDFFWSIILELKNNGCTIIFSTHDFGNKLKYCDKFLFIVKGNKVEYGSLVEIQSRNEMLLEIESEDVKETDFLNIVSENKLQCKGGCYKIPISNEEEAKQIFIKLNKPFCKKFIVRKLEIDELFRNYNMKYCN